MHASKRPGTLPSWLRRLRRLVAFVCFLYFVAVCMLVVMETALVYPRPSVEDGNWAPTAFQYEDVTFVSPDGTQLHGWFLEHPSPRHHILFFHGNAEHVAYLGQEMDQLRERYAASVFVFDFRGYGRSQGSPNEAGILADGVAAQRWLEQRAGIGSDEIVLYGRSLGGGVAVANASSEGAAALVLDRTFDSMVDVAAKMHRWAPVRLLMRNRYPSAERIALYDGPLLQMHGTADEIIPFPSGKRLHDACPSHQKRFIEFDGMLHNDSAPPAFFQALDDLLDSLAT